jgi:hypothetical protein
VKKKLQPDADVEDLVERFVSIALAQDRAMFKGNSRTYNRLYDEMGEVIARLKVVAGDGRRHLIALHQHPNAQVRLKSAIHTLALEPEAARGVLQSICDRREFPQAADACGMMMSLDEGRYIPK